MTWSSTEQRARWRRMLTEQRVRPSADNVLALLNELEEVECERDAQAAEINSLTADWDAEHARAEWSEAMLARVKTMLDDIREGIVREEDDDA